MSTGIKLISAKIHEFSDGGRSCSQEDAYIGTQRQKETVMTSGPTVIGQPKFQPRRWQIGAACGAALILGVAIGTFAWHGHGNSGSAGAVVAPVQQPSFSSVSREDSIGGVAEFITNHLASVPGASISQADARGGYAESLSDGFTSRTITAVSPEDAVGGYAEFIRDRSVSAPETAVPQASARGGYAEYLQDRLVSGTITSVAREDAIGGFAESLR
jgi:hypothetical protein